MDASLPANAVSLCGTAAEEPVFSHENHGQRFFRFPLRVVRLSRQADVLPILAPAELLAPLLPLAGRRLSVQGQLRSFNNKSGVGSRLVLSVLARELSLSGEEDHNAIRLSGVICKQPVLRRTPLGRCICDILLAVNRRYGRTDYLPCIAWGQAAAAAGALPVGSPLGLEGRVQSREYTKVLADRAEVRTAFEVSITRLTE